VQYVQGFWFYPFDRSLPVRVSMEVIRGVDMSAHKRECLNAREMCLREMIVLC